jgi:hypothetical protein
MNATSISLKGKWNARFEDGTFAGSWSLSWIAALPGRPGPSDNCCGIG